MPGAPIAIFADRQYLACQISRLNSPAFAKCARSRDFLHLLLRIASKVNPSGWQFYLMSFQNCHIAAIGEKNRQVCPHQSVTKIACDFRCRSNLPRSAYKIARCVPGFIVISQEQLINMINVRKQCQVTKLFTLFFFTNSLVNIASTENVLLV